MASMTGRSLPLQPGVAFPLSWVRRQFPALTSDPILFMDNAAGAQIPVGVLDAVTGHLLHRNVQRGGRYPHSLAVDAMVTRARQNVAWLVNAERADEIAFGMNATSFLRLISLGIAETLTDRKEIVVTDLDHDSNISTWLALEKMGATVKWWRMRDDGGLHLEDLLPLLSERTRLVACTAASHALGTFIDVAAVARAAHQAGADMLVDCVHYCPHAPIDVALWDCDYLVCSGYKAFSPHMGFMWGKFDKLVALPTFREDFIPDRPPHKIEAGTFVYENVAGMAAVVDYLCSLADELGHEGAGTRPAVVAAMEAIKLYERSLSERVHAVLADCGATIYGLADPRRFDERAPTFSFNLPGTAPAAVVQAMADAGIAIRDGHMYAPRLMNRLGLPLHEGVVRLSLVHYNGVDEIDRFADVLRGLSLR
ncbi:MULTISPECIES: cysteine desulfurase-like protein [unclassified Sphingomonas]|uniref:cysteine desulfurase-like protein n=2 Tax=Sphingomonas TaxID=13687 RepID=UPI000AD4E7C0|nr:MULTISPECIES: cysteine desulfurase-like protein [unclassified Sphingomonas]